MRNQSPTFAALAAAVLLTGCATPRAVTHPGPYNGFDPRKRDPQLTATLRGAGLEAEFRRDPDQAALTLASRTSRAPDERLALARVLLHAGTRHDRKGAEESAAGRYLESARESAAVLHDRRAVAARDHALTLYSTASIAFLRLWADLPTGARPRQSWRVEGIHGAHTVTLAALPQYEWPKDRITELIPADTVRRRRLQPRVTIDGIGMPMVGSIMRRPGELAPRRNDVAVTALLDPAEAPGKPDEVALIDPKRAESIPFAGGRLPVAADFTTPLDRELLIHRGIRLMEIMGVFNPAKFMQKEGIHVLDPFDPDRIPVVFIHGLQSSSFAWLPMINGLTADPEIRKRCQFWVYQYPTGLPIALASAQVRRHLDKIQSLYREAGRAHHGNRMVLVGHSMGGLHSRMQIIDSGDDMLRTVFQVPIDNAPLSAEAKSVLREALIFERRPYVSRVIFIATPHQGCGIASGWVGRVTISLIRIPGTLIGTTADLLLLKQGIPGVLLRRPPTSISGLNPNSSYVKALGKRPLPPEVPYHSIIGDRGRGDTPNSSDGVVPYWSSRVECATSERIIPSDHGALKHPEGIAEVRRILREHLAAIPPAAEGGRRAPLH